MTAGILFADIAGSTRLYQDLGDASAQALVRSSLALLTRVAERYDGRLVKTIGDEIMCRFPDAERALRAACAMQVALRAEAPPGPVAVKVRIGLHVGPTIDRERDVFGDAVNTAARLRDIARPGQVITTAETVAAASADVRAKARLVDRAVLPGRSQETDVYELLWDPLAKVTLLAMTLDAQTSPASAILRLRHLGEERTVQPSDVVRLGRDPECELLVASDLASRQHARIEYSRGKFVLTDDSTNGTFVLVDGATEVYLRRESLPLSGRGLIGLGCSCVAGNDLLVRYSCE
ncbi:MAG: adenylate/guanylate cyclase domain-containing protein [Vicinamibacterales bacterium]